MEKTQEAQSGKFPIVCRCCRRTIATVRGVPCEAVSLVIDGLCAKCSKDLAGKGRKRSPVKHYG